MKKLLIILVAFVLCLNLNIVFAEDNTKVSINEIDSDNYKVEITANLASLEPTIQVNTDFDVATVYKGEKANNDYVISKTEDGIVSFDVNTAGTYYVSRGLTINNNTAYDNETKTALSNMDKTRLTIVDKSGNPINVSTISNFTTAIATTTPSQSDRTKLDEKIEGNIGASNIVDAFFFDITCVLNGSNLKDFGSTDDELIPVSFDLPIVLAEGQELRLFRLHEGVVKELKIDSFVDGKVSFKSSHYSTYAFVVANKATSSSGTSYFKVPKTCID